MCQQWPLCQNRPKTTTAVLIRLNDKTVVDFGASAVDKFVKKHKEATGAVLFQRFKMKLKGDEDFELDKAPTLTAEGGEHKMDSLDVFAAAIGFLRNHLIEQLGNSTGALKTKKESKEIDMSQILWVLTVPAIWSDGAKELMRNGQHRMLSVLTRVLARSCCEGWD